MPSIRRPTTELLIIGMVALGPLTCRRAGDVRSGDVRSGEQFAARRVNPPRVPGASNARSEPEAYPDARESLLRAAAEGDPMDLQRLAALEGASGLLDYAERRGELARVALDALPFAEGRSLMLGRLCRRFEGATGSERSQLLRVLHQVAADPNPTGELLDPEGARACQRALLRLLGMALTPSEVDWASGASERLGP